MVEVFKTNISDEQTAALILEQLWIKLPDAKINFDLEDCDHILRVESEVIVPQLIQELLQQQGFCCEVLE